MIFYNEDLNSFSTEQLEAEIKRRKDEESAKRLVNLTWKNVMYIRDTGGLCWFDMFELSRMARQLGYKYMLCGEYSTIYEVRENGHWAILSGVYSSDIK